jgi:hypothetical protein
MTELSLSYAKLFSFRLLKRGSEVAGVFAYDGRLFDEAETPTATAGAVANRHVVQAIKALTKVVIAGLPQYVDYAHLGVEELGAVYESLLPFALRVTTDGRVYLDPVSTDRADLGAHYSRPELVDFVLELSLDRLIKERLDTAGDDQGTRLRALLDIRVLDPACGSGAFLVGAIDRLSAAIAAEREGAAKPTEQGLAHARRDVLQHCIYGVDKDLFAVELCKVALWIHCAVKDLPLTFLDHRIQHGDSLVGWPLLEVPKAIPLEAYDAPTGGDRVVRQFLASARRRNELVLAGQAELGRDLPMPQLAIDFPDLAAEEERIPADVTRKASLLEEYLRSLAYRRWKRAADLWTAAFFWGPASGPPPGSDDYWRALDDEADAEMASSADAILAEFPAFHWPLRFHGIRERGGFDCILGNPPWEQVKLNEQEWFLPWRPDIAAMASARRRVAIAELSQTAPALDVRWRRAVWAEGRLAEYMRNCGRYTPSGSEANTYLLFTELAARLLRPDGRAGLIVKSALALDSASQVVFQHLLRSGQVEELHDIVNGGPTGRERVFVGVADVERFSVLGLRGRREHDGFVASVMNWNVEEARTRPRQRFTHGLLRTLNPRTGSLTSFRLGPQLDVALEIHGRLQTLDFEAGGKNHWQLKYGTLFHGSADADLFRRREELEADAWVLGRDKIFRRKTPVVADGQGDLLSDGPTEYWPLYEGQLASRFDHRAKTYESYSGLNKYGRKPGLPVPSDSQKSDPHFEMEPRYWMACDVALKRIEQVAGDRVIVGIRDVGAPWRNQRSARAAILPRYPATNALPIFAIPRTVALEFVALFNSTVFDFLVRGHMPGAHVALTWMLSQIAAPVPGLDPRIAQASRRLSLTSYSVARVFDTEICRWDAGERYQLDVEIDALLAHAYGLAKHNYAVVLDSFELMAREQTRLHGHFKYKDDCLEAYDRV